MSLSITAQNDVYFTVGYRTSIVYEPVGCGMGYARFGKRIASQRGLYLQLWFMAGLMSVVFGALLALKPVPKPVSRRKIHTKK